MNNPKISVITVCFNAEKSIQNTLDSVKAQQYPNLEYIIVDGASTDKTLSVIKQHQLNPDTLISEKDKGIYDGINKGIKAATGDIIGLLHADDFYAHPQVLTNIASAFQRLKCDILYGDLEYVKETAAGFKPTRKWRAGKYTKGAFLKGWMPPHPSLYIKKECFDEVGLYRTDMKIAGDYEFMLRLMHKHAKFSVFYLPEVLVKMKVGGASNANMKNRMLANEEDAKAWLLNGLTPKWYTRYLKPIRKIPQFLGF